MSDAKQLPPATLDEAVGILKEHLSHDLKNIVAMNEDEFLGKAHHSLGQSIRNSWLLWWTEKGAKQYDKWPKEKPAIVNYFNLIGIYHADDMSGIILTSFHRSLTGKPWSVEKQVEHYKEYWESKGIDVKKDIEG